MGSPTLPVTGVRELPFDKPSEYGGRIIPFQVNFNPAGAVYGLPLLSSAQWANLLPPFLTGNFGTLGNGPSCVLFDLKALALPSKPKTIRSLQFSLIDWELADSCDALGPMFTYTLDSRQLVWIPLSGGFVPSTGQGIAGFASGVIPIVSNGDTQIVIGKLPDSKAGVTVGVAGTGTFIAADYDMRAYQIDGFGLASYYP